jgi:hypothetical protein
MSDAPERTTIAGSSPPLAAPVVDHGRLVGAHLNEMFEVTRFLAQGGMGEVYEGRNLQSDERVAIKVILPRFAADEQFFALFKREAGALARLGHDALVKYRTLAFDRALGAHYLVTEFVPGPNLEDVLDGTPAPSARASAFLERMAGGLAAAHAVGVLHRDLSPDNILLPEGALERAKIIDFGLAKDTTPDAKSVVGDSFAGKLGYAAPEVFGKYGRALGPWTDVYSLALVVGALAKGRPIDMGSGSIVDALEARETVPDLEGVDAALRPVLAAMLEPDPARRLADMPAVLAALAGGVSARVGVTGGQAEPVPMTPRFERAASAPDDKGAARPGSKLPLIAGGVGLVAVAGLAYALLGGWPDKVPAPVPATVTTVATAMAPVASPKPPPVAAVAQSAPAPDWSAAAPIVARALAAVPCSDLHVAAPPALGATTVTLAGWRPHGAPLPADAGGFRLGPGHSIEVDAPSAGTCALLDQLRAVTTPPGGAPVLSAERRIVLSRQRIRSAGSKQSFDFDPLGGARPRGDTLLVINIDDAPPTATQRFLYAELPHTPLGFDALAPKRYLFGVIVAPHLPKPATDTSAEPIESLCRAAKCTLATGWIEVTQ